MPGQHVCLTGATLTCGINSRGRSLWCRHWDMGGGVGMLLRVSSAAGGGKNLFFCPHRRDVFACIGLPDGDSSWERSYSRWPLGVCDYLVPVHRQFHPEKWADRTRNLYNWSEPHNRCTRTGSSMHRFTVS